MILGQFLKFIFRRFSGLCPENKQEHVVFSPPVKKKIKNSPIEARNEFSKIAIFSVVFLKGNQWKIVLIITLRNLNEFGPELLCFLWRCPRYNVPILKWIGVGAASDEAFRVVDLVRKSFAGLLVHFSSNRVEILYSLQGGRAAEFFNFLKTCIFRWICEF